MYCDYILKAEGGLYLKKQSKTHLLILFIALLFKLFFRHRKSHKNVHFWLKQHPFNQ